MIAEPTALIMACALDAIAGDPRWIPHPVAIIGRLIERLEATLRVAISNTRMAGVALAALITTGVFVAAYSLQWALSLPAGKITGIMAAGAYVYLISTTVAFKGLMDSVREVLGEQDLETARQRLSMIVGRDTAQMDMDDIRRAALETLSENASDGIIAPLFYFALGGLPLAMLYKAVNTLDSMVGYKNDKYINMGWASARLDDIMNYLPSRLTGLLIAGAAFFVKGADAGISFRIMLRDGALHKSPNAGMPEAALSGAVDIRMGGPSIYEGTVVEKPWIGRDLGNDYQNASASALKVTALASVFGMALAVAGTLIRTYI